MSGPDDCGFGRCPRWRRGMVHVRLEVASDAATGVMNGHLHDCHHACLLNSDERRLGRYAQTCGKSVPLPDDVIGGGAGCDRDDQRQKRGSSEYASTEYGCHTHKSISFVTNVPKLA